MTPVCNLGSASAAAYVDGVRVALGLCACFLAVASFVGCAGNDTALGADTVRVTAKEMHFTPSRLLAAAGVTTITVHNAGTLTHTFSLNDVGRETTVAPGKTKTFHVTLAAGKYRYVCRILDHEGLGMHGVLTVQPS